MPVLPIIVFITAILLIAALTSDKISFFDLLRTVIVAVVVAAICTCFLIWLIKFMQGPVYMDPLGLEIINNFN